MVTNLNAIIKAGIELYTERKVESLERFDDPKVSGAMALRVTMEDKSKIDFLICADGKNVKTLHRNFELTPGIVEQVLEEAEFTSWPPTSGRLKFF